MDLNPQNLISSEAKSLKFLSTLPDHFFIEVLQTKIEKKSISIFDPCHDLFLSKHFYTDDILVSSLGGDFAGKMVASFEKKDQENTILATLWTQQFLSLIKREYGINGHMFPFINKNRRDFSFFTQSYSAILIEYSMEKKKSKEMIRFFIIN